MVYKYIYIYIYIFTITIYIIYHYSNIYIYIVMIYNHLHNRLIWKWRSQHRSRLGSWDPRCWGASGGKLLLTAVILISSAWTDHPNYMLHFLWTIWIWRLFLKLAHPECWCVITFFLPFGITWPCWGLSIHPRGEHFAILDQLDVVGFPLENR